MNLRSYQSLINYAEVDLKGLGDLLNREMKLAKQVSKTIQRTVSG
ncbi:hypothetical protein [Streptococcus dentiloxodontae]